jgi:hypothetical protein
VLAAEKAVQKASTRAKQAVRSLARERGGGAKPANTENDHTFEDDNDSRPQGQQLTQVKKVLARMKVLLDLEEGTRKGAEAMLAVHRSLARSAARAIGKLDEVATMHRVCRCCSRQFRHWRTSWSWLACSRNMRSASCLV